MKNLTERIQGSLGNLWQRSDRTALLLFAPACFFVLLALMVVIVPHAILFLLASVFIFAGIFCAVLAVKLLQFKRKVTTVLRQVKGNNIVIQATQYPQEQFETEILEEEKKFIIH
jgi:hypothetical protein